MKTWWSPSIQVSFFLPFFCYLYLFKGGDLVDSHLISTTMALMYISYQKPKRICWKMPLHTRMRWNWYSKPGHQWAVTFLPASGPLKKYRQKIMAKHLPESTVSDRLWWPLRKVTWIRYPKIQHIFNYSQ